MTHHVFPHFPAGAAAQDADSSHVARIRQSNDRGATWSDGQHCDISNNMKFVLLLFSQLKMLNYFFKII